MSVCLAGRMMTALLASCGTGETVSTTDTIAAAVSQA